MYFLFIILIFNIFVGGAFAEESDCVTRNVKNVRDSCDKEETRLRGGSPYHACDLVMGHINCHIQSMTEKCGENGTRLYMRTVYKPAIEASACGACEKGYHRMEEFGGHLYHEDPGGEPLSTFCNRHDYISMECPKSDKRELLADLAKCEQLFANEIDQMIKIESLQEKKVAYCSALDYVVRCIYFDVWTHCDGKETNESDAKAAKEYMQKIGWTVPYYSFCAICERTNNFLKRIIGKELYSEDKTWVAESIPASLADTNVLRVLDSDRDSLPIDHLPSGGLAPGIFPADMWQNLSPNTPVPPNQGNQTNGYWSIRPVYCQTFEPDPSLLTTPASPDTSSTLTPQPTELSTEISEISTSITSETTEVSTRLTVPPPCVQWRNVSSEIKDCSTVQQTFMDPRQTCQYKLATAKCVWDKITQTCTQEDAKEFMRTYFLTVEYHVCPYCKEVSDYLEDNGGQLYQLGGPSSVCTHKQPVPAPEPVCPDVTNVPRCFLNFQLISFLGGEIDHQATCRHIMEFVECEYNEVRISCGNDKANEYMKNRIFNVLDEKYCEVPHCKQIAHYLETQFGNHLYYGTNNEKCKWTKPNIDTCIDQEAVKSCSLSSGTDPEIDCKNKFLEVKCKFDSVKTTCDQDIAIQHMNTTQIVVEATECQICILAVQFLEGYGSYLKIQGSNAEHCELKGNKSAEVTERPPIDLSCTESEVLTTDIAMCDKEYRINNSSDPKEICGKQLEIAKCVYKAVKMACNERIAAAFMRTPLFYIYNGICTECTEYVKFLEKFGGNLFAIGGHARTCNANPSPSSSPEPTEAFPCEQTEQIPRRCKQLGIVAHNKEQTCEYVYQMAMCIFDEVKRNCNHTTAFERMKISSFAIPDASYCEPCRKAVRFLSSLGSKLYYGREEEGECQSLYTTLQPTVSTTTEISNGSTDSTTTAFSTTTAEPEKCEDILAMKRTIMFCMWDVENPEDPERAICDRVLDAAKCLYEGALDAGCDNQTAMAYMGSATLTVDYKNCGNCKKAIEYLEERGGHLYAYGAIGDNTTMCTETPVGPPPEPLCPEIDTTSTPGACAQVRIASDEKSEACDSLYIMLECMTTETKTKCNETIARNYMARAVFGIPRASYCPACENVIKYLKAMGNHLYDYSTPNGTCDDSFITVPTFATISASSPSLPLTSTTSPTETTTTDTTIPTTFLWYPDFPCITDEAGKNITNLCGSGRDHGTQGGKDAKWACNATANWIKCVSETVASVCDDTNTHAFMKNTKMFDVDPEWCPYCSDAIKLTAKFDGHVFERDHNGVPTNRFCKPNDCSSSAVKSRIEKKCVIHKKTTPEDVCSELLRVAKCFHVHVEEQCDLSKADSYMKSDFSAKVKQSECPHCADVVEYMGSFGGQVYLQNGKTVCDAKENAALSIYHTVPFFYVLLIFCTFFV